MMFSKRIAICFSIFLCLVVSVCKGEGYEPAPNCGHNYCPSYTVVESGKEFEIRSYKDAQWVSGPNVSSQSYKGAADKGFLILFAYYKGNNREHVTINMTTPVLVDVLNSTYTVYFYLPQKYQNTLPPPPESNEIKAVKLPKHKFAAVRRFDGFITDDVVPIQIAALRKSLQGTPYQRAATLDLFTLAGYNSPFELKNRVNEVFIWFD